MWLPSNDITLIAFNTHFERKSNKACTAYSTSFRRRGWWGYYLDRESEASQACSHLRGLRKQCPDTNCILLCCDLSYHPAVFWFSESNGLQCWALTCKVRCKPWPMMRVNGTIWSRLKLWNPFRACLNCYTCVRLVADISFNLERVWVFSLANLNDIWLYYVTGPLFGIWSFLQLSCNPTLEIVWPGQFQKTVPISWCTYGIAHRCSSGPVYLLASWPQSDA